MDNLLWSTLIRTVIAYFLLLFMTRIMGRKAISQMTFFDFAVGITLGTITGSLALSSKYTPLSAGLVLISFSLLTVFVGYLSIKSFRLRKLFNSEPVVVIENGEINKVNMKKTRYTMDNLLMMLRKKNIFNISDVEFAVMETDGKLSVLPKSQHKNLTPADLNLPTGYVGLTKDLIIDGQVLEENLRDAQLNRSWLTESLRARGIDAPEEVFYAGLDTAGKLYISLKEEKHEQEGKYGFE